MRIIDYALALDGGSQIMVLETTSGEQVTIGLDGRMTSPNSGKQLLIGLSPDSPDAQLLPVGGIEERELILLLEQWADETQGFLRREVLMESEQSELEGQDLLDRLALQFLLDIKNRDIS